MTRFVKDAAVRQIQTLYRAGALGGLTDRELLEQFVTGSEGEAAFEVLVKRDGPMVRAMCRSLLGDFHEADDAFQATFLVLARRAGAIRDKDAVASWLYGVAARTCSRARAEGMRRRTLSRYLIERARQEETSEALGVQRLRLIDAATEPAQRTIRLRPVGSVEGRILTDRPEWAAGVPLYATTELDPAAALTATEGSARVVTQADGSFTIPAIASGKLKIAARFDQALPVRPRLPETLEVRSGQTTHTDIPLEKAVRVSGVIRVRDTGEPVAGASIFVGYGSYRQGDMVVSDAKGHFATYVLAGDALTQVISMPDQFVQLGDPWNERHPVSSGAATFDLPAIKVVKGVVIKGRLVDMADRPIANLRIVGAAGHRRYAFATTDPNGEFTTNSVPPGMKLSYSVMVNDREPPVDATILKEEPLLLRAPIGASSKLKGGRRRD